jgi:GTP cyclohydrolase I
MTRPQIQEEATQMLADLIEKELQPKGLAIVMKAKHYCMCWRGVKDPDCEMTTSVVRGLLKNAEARNEFLNLIR